MVLVNIQIPKFCSPTNVTSPYEFNIFEMDEKILYCNQSIKMFLFCTVGSCLRQKVDPRCHHQHPDGRANGQRVPVGAAVGPVRPQTHLLPVYIPARSVEHHCRILNLLANVCWFPVPYWICFRSLSVRLSLLHH